MNKRGLSSIVNTVIVILLVLVAISIISLVVFNVARDQGEIASARGQLVSEKMSIKRVVGDFQNPGKINLTIERGNAKQILRNISVESISVGAKIDMFSVADLSGSMNTSYCTNRSGICNNNARCIGVCGGSWTTSVNELKNASFSLIDKALDGGNNRLGLVTYATTASISNFHPLSNNKVSLKGNVSGWSASGTTCICCGIKKASDNYNMSADTKRIMILMSDGEANVNCSLGGDAKNDSVESARRANNKNITIYSIGFGGGVDSATLTRISEATGGKYYYADIGQLEIVYSTIVEEIKSDYESVISSSYLLVVFHNATDTYSEKIFDPPQNPFETRVYSIPSSGSLPITNVTRIEIFPVIITESGKEVTWSASDIWTA